MHSFARVCHEYGIEHRLTKLNHPWTNGQVERMHRTLKDATVKRYHDERHHQLKEHLYTFLNAYNFAKRLKTLHGLTPYACIIRCWQKEPERFRINPAHHIVGLNNLRTGSHLGSSLMPGTSARPCRVRNVHLHRLIRIGRQRLSTPFG
jgi:oligoribonuclease NrnB/cAMP/cGMP phosphodiesterase (DHH superfamily)